MAHVITLFNRKHQILTEIFEEAQHAASLLKHEFESAVFIQAWFRGVRLRAYLKHLNTSATTIQKHWRAYVARGIFRRIVESNLRLMREAYYNTMATVIQKVWRGYFVRKYVHNFYSRQKYLDAVVEMNSFALDDLYRYEENVVAMAKKTQAERLEHNRVLNATRNHFMLSTTQSAGVYALSSCKENNEIELIMQKLKSHELQAFRQNYSQEFSSPSPCTAPSRDQFVFAKSSASPDIASIASESSKPSPLPGINITMRKQQGPFKTVEQVQRIKNRPLHPTLRVSTDFYSVEKARESMIAQEEVKQVIDDRFSPFKTVRHDYIPMLHTNSKYGTVKYGSEHFREEDEGMLTLKERFKTVLPPIKVFDQANSSF